jgi:hypothetical protein
MHAGFIVLFCWLAISVCITALGWLIGNKAIIGTGAVMLLMMAAVSGVQ